MTRALGSTAVAALAAITAAGAAPAWAQEPQSLPEAAASESAAASEDQDIIVTGSFIRRDRAQSASPITTVGREEFQAIGANRIADLTQTLTISAGAENFSDAFNGQQSVGTENINLRGLGVQSTLVLLNGRRQVLTATTTADGVSFVDTASLVPAIAVQRLEIVTDGASALYGSDAVAGVANFLTRNTFEGFDVDFEYRPQVDQGAQRDLSVEAIFGAQGDRGGVIAAVSWLDRTRLGSDERPLFLPAFASSAFGNPGAFGLSLPVAAVDAQGNPIQNPNGTFQVAVPAGFPPGLTDPGCAAFGGAPGTPTGTGNGIAGPCFFNFGPFFDLVPEEERINGFAAFHYQLNDIIKARGELGYARNRSDSRGSPTNPLFSLPFNLVPPSNPGAQATQFPGLGGPNGGFTLATAPSIVTAPDGTQSIQIGQAATFIGRPIAALGLDGATPAQASDFDFASDTFRAVIGFEAEYANWVFDTSFTYAANDFDNLAIDAIPQQFAAALNGFGGIGCPGPLGNVAAGTGPCEFFNPFSTGLGSNSQNVLDSFVGFQTIDSASELQVFDAVASTASLFSLPAGDVGLALGFQYRAENLSRDFDAVTNTTGFSQRPQQDDFSGSRRVLAGFAEVSIPVIENLEIQAAVRVESFNLGQGTTVDPKVAVLYRPTDWLSLRGSYSTSFRAPSLFQTFGEQVTLQGLADPLFPAAGLNFVAIVASGNADIAPETSRAFNAGLTLKPLPGLSIDLDYFNFSFEDVIIVESAQALINADPDAPEILRSDTAAGPGTGFILAVNVDFTNAASVDTAGLDFNTRWEFDTPIGAVVPSFQGAWLFRYDLADPFAGAIDGLGSRNGANFGVPTPEFRFNAGLAWALGPHSVNVFGRYIGGLSNDEALPASNPLAAAVNTLPAQVTFDAQYNLDLSRLLDLETGVTLSVGGINLTSNEPPLVNESIGFESRVFDPRGRILYTRLGFSF